MNNNQKRAEQILSMYSNASISKSEENDLEKGGEGSRGGKIIGHTKSGKSIYDPGHHLSHIKTDNLHPKVKQFHKELLNSKRSVYKEAMGQRLSGLDESSDATTHLYHGEHNYKDKSYDKISDHNEIDSKHEEYSDLMKQHIAHKDNLRQHDTLNNDGKETPSYHGQVSKEDLKHYMDLSSMSKQDRDIAKKKLSEIALKTIKELGLKKKEYGFQGKSSKYYTVDKEDLLKSDEDDLEKGESN